MSGSMPPVPRALCRKALMIISVLFLIRVDSRRCGLCRCGASAVFSKESLAGLGSVCEAGTVGNAPKPLGAADE